MLRIAYLEMLRVERVERVQVYKFFIFLIFFIAGWKRKWKNIWTKNISRINNKPICKQENEGEIQFSTYLISLDSLAVQWMSEYRTSSDFRQFSWVPFPDSSDFRQCLKSELKVLISDTFFCLKSELQKT